jgi:hypothetical protein
MPVRLMLEDNAQPRRFAWNQGRLLIDHSHGNMIFVARRGAFGMCGCRTRQQGNRDRKNQSHGIDDRIA